MTAIPLSHLRFNQDTWVRDAVDRGRVEMFCLQIQEGANFPPIEVVQQADCTYLIGDGVHRCLAVQRAGRSEVDAVVVQPKEGESTTDCAQRIGLETASRGPLPLTMAERRRAVVHLLATQPDLSRRSIAQLVAVSHSTVGRWAVEVDQSSTAEDNSRRWTQVGPSPEKVARGLVGTLDRLSESRGLLDYLAPRRMGRYLAGAFTDRFGDSAQKEARLFQAWINAALAALEEEAE